jgi:hypothetical protein
MPSLGRDGKTRRHAYRIYLVLAVMVGVMTAGLDVVMFGVAGMAVGAVGVVRGFFVIAGLMMLGGFAVMLGCVLVMFGGLVMVLDACMVAHVSLPVRHVKTRRRFTQAI